MWPILLNSSTNLFIDSSLRPLTPKCPSRQPHIFLCYSSGLTSRMHKTPCFIHKPFPIRTDCLTAGSTELSHLSCTRSLEHTQQIISKTRYKQSILRLSFIYFPSLQAVSSQTQLFHIELHENKYLQVSPSPPH